MLTEQRIDFSSHYLHMDDKNDITTVSKEGYWDRMKRRVCIQQNPHLVAINKYLQQNPPTISNDSSNRETFEANLKDLNARFHSGNQNKRCIEKILKVYNAVVKYKLFKSIFEFFGLKPKILHDYTHIQALLIKYTQKEEPHKAEEPSKIEDNISKIDCKLEFTWGSPESPPSSPLAHRIKPEFEFQKLKKGLVSHIPLILSSKHQEKRIICLKYDLKERHFFLQAKEGQVSIWQEDKCVSTLMNITTKLNIHHDGGVITEEYDSATSSFPLEFNTSYQLKMPPKVAKINGKTIKNDGCIAELKITSES